MNSSKLLAAAAAISVIGAATFAVAQTTPTTPAQSPAATSTSPDPMPVQAAPMTPMTPMMPVTPRATDGGTTDLGNAGTPADKGRTGTDAVNADGTSGSARINSGAAALPDDASSRRSAADRDRAYGERAARADRN